MWFFRKRRLGQTERLEMALRDKQELRQKLARRLNTAEMFVTDRREAGERLALDGASDEALGRAEASTRAAEDRARTLRAALAQLEAQITEMERELGATVERRYRDTVADTLETLVAGIAQTAPGYDGGRDGFDQRDCKDSCRAARGDCPYGRPRGNTSGSRLSGHADVHGVAVHCRAHALG